MTVRLNSGDACPNCATGRLRTYSSRRASSGWQTRYLDCRHCGFQCKTLIAVGQIWRRTKSDRSIVEQLPLNQPPEAPE